MGMFGKVCKMIGDFADTGSAVATGTKVIVTNLCAAGAAKSETVYQKAYAENLVQKDKITKKVKEKVGVDIDFVNARDFLRNAGNVNKVDNADKEEVKE